MMHLNYSDRRTTTALALCLLLATISGKAQQPVSNSSKKSAAAPAVSPAATVTPVAVTTTSGGTKGTIPMFSNSTNIENTTLYYSNTGLGIGRSPSQMLDVNGNSVFRGYMQVARTADATPAAGTKSYPIQFNLQVYNSAKALALNPFFNFQAEPTGNNTGTTGATLNLLYFGGVGAPTATETGLYFSNNGVIHFAPAQTFPITTGAQGPAGPTGPAGPSGPTGPQGPQGPAGTIALPYTGSGAGANAFAVTNTGTTNGGGLYGAGAAGNQTASGGPGVTGSGGSGTANYPAGSGLRGFGGPAAAQTYGTGGVGVEGTGGKTSVSGTYGGRGGVFIGGGGPGAGAEGLAAFGGDGTNGARGGDGLIAFPGAGGKYAGVFIGNVTVSGSLSKSGGSFKIDDPIDPANKYLSHSFVESPDMMNIYNGNVTTDGQGEAVVTMPDWFEALNRDFRYQLTTIGGFAQATVATEISNGRFTIRTDRGNVKVSWQVTGVRQDAWANAHRIPVEEDKTAKEKGHYMQPELYGHTGEASVFDLHSRPSQESVAGVE